MAFKYIVDDIKMSRDWSFIICTDGTTNPEYHQAIIESIKKQCIPNYEVLFITENFSYNLEQDNVTTIYVSTPKEKHITFKKNRAAKFCKYDNLCILHDYITLADNWYKSFDIFGYDWNVCACKNINKDGTRTWDWCTWNHPEYRHNNVDYNLEATEYHYVPGTSFCVKRDYFLKHPLDERRVWGEGEDIEWSHRICKYDWKYKINLYTNFNFLKQK